MAAEPLTHEEYQHLIRASHVYSGALRTPLDQAPHLSNLCGNTVWLKREDLQPIFSFKLRGAFNFMASLPQKQLAKGVVAASAGNHAQGVALSAKKLQTKAVIVVPIGTPEIKQTAIKALGAELILHGDTYMEAEQHARSVGEERSLVFVHPYDDPKVIAGQGTVGLEMAEQCPVEPDAVFAPIGGGGLIAGIALAVKQAWPNTKVIGVEPDDACAMKLSMESGQRVVLDRVGLLADGVAVKQVGEETFRLCKDLVDEVITVNGDEICAAVKQIFEGRRAIAEPAGALAWAGIHKWAQVNGESGKNLVGVLSGANTGFDRLRYIGERALIGEGHEGVLAIIIPERAGAFRELSRLFGSHSVTEFNYRMGDPNKAVVYAGIEIRERSELDEIIKALRANGYETHDLTDDEIAKTHVRHMVGGRAPLADGERIFHFDFPEKPNALGHFLDHLEGWSISCFHYRSHGSEIGRVLAGFINTPGSQGSLDELLETVHYPATEVTDDPSIKLFLQ